MPGADISGKWYAITGTCAVGGVDDLAVVADRVGAAGRRQHEHAVGAAGGDVGGEAGGLAGRRRTGPDDDRDAGRDRLAARP